MLIKKIELTNWGPHQHLHVDAGTNVVGVIGPNGKGKSNFLQAIDYGLNGNLNKRNQKKYIYNFGLDGGAKSATVHIEFVKDGKQGDITRTITGSASKRSLVWDGQTYTSDADVSRVMTELLGADKMAMANAIFVKQGDLAHLVNGTPAERQEIFQKLMNLNFIDARVVDLQNKITKLQTGLADYTPALTAANERAKELRDRIAGDNKLLATCCDYTDDIALLERWQRDMDNIQSCGLSCDRARAVMESSKTSWTSLLSLHGDATDTKIEELTTRRDEVRDIIATMSSLSKIVQTLDETNKSIAELERTQAEWRNQLAAMPTLELCEKSQRSWIDYSKKIESVRTAADIVARTNNKLEQARSVYNDADAIVTVRVPEYEEESTQLTPLIERLNTELGPMRIKMDLCNTPEFNAPVCPVCGSPHTPPTKEALEALRVEFNAKTEELKQASSKKAWLDTTIEMCRRKREEAKEALTLAEAEQVDILNRFGDIADTPVEATSDEAQSNIRVFGELITKHAQLAASIESSESHHAALLASRASSEESLQTSSAEFDAVSLTNATSEFNTVEAELRSLTSVRQCINEAKTAYDVNTQTFEREVARMDALQKAFGASSTESEVMAMVGDDESETDQMSKVAARKNAMQEAQTTYRITAARIEQSTRDLSELDAQIADLHERINKDKERRDLIDDLNKVKQLVSKNGLPLMYMNTVFRHIAGMVQDMLSRMEANFAVLVDEERPLTFKFVRLDNGSGYEMEQELLSGGQAIRLALALLIACQQIILPKVGLLVLDEPSSHVDEAGVENLKELFIKMTSIFRNSETQLIVVDHNTILNTAFEKTINL